MTKLIYKIINIIFIINNIIIIDVYRRIIINKNINQKQKKIEETLKIIFNIVNFYQLLNFTETINNILSNLQMGKSYFIVLLF